MGSTFHVKVKDFGAPFSSSYFHVKTFHVLYQYQYSLRYIRDGFSTILRTNDT